MDSSRKQVVLLIDVVNYLILFKYKPLETRWKLSVRVRIFGVFYGGVILVLQKNIKAIGGVFSYWLSK